MTEIEPTVSPPPAPQPPAGVLPPALSERDPDYIRRSLRFTWPLIAAWFRPDVRGLDRIPARGPVLLVGNHSGGNVAPDTLAFTLAFYRHFGVDRPFFQLAHHLVMQSAVAFAAAQVRDHRGQPGELPGRAGPGRGRPRLPGRRLGGAPTLLARSSRRVRRP